METMKLEFTDGRRIEVNAIYGSPQLVHSAMRDTLQIEIDPEKINFNSLKALFSETGNLEEIYSVTITESKFDGQITEDKVTIGQGYTILVSITDENRTESPEPGTWAAPTIKEVFIVTIAQETYAEHQLRILQNSSNE